jgi:hypothetical protein
MLGWMSAFLDCCYVRSACWPAGCVEMTASWNNICTRSLRFLVYNHLVTFISYEEVSCSQSKWKLIIWWQTFYDWDAWCLLSVWMPNRLKCLRTASNGEVLSILQPLMYMSTYNRFRLHYYKIITFFNILSLGLESVLEHFLKVLKDLLVESQILNITSLC